MSAALAALRRLEKRLAVSEVARVHEPEALRVETKPAEVPLEERLRAKARAVRATVRAWPSHFLAVRQRWERFVGELEREGLAMGLSAREAREDAEVLAFDTVTRAAVAAGVSLPMGDTVRPETAQAMRERAARSAERSGA